ncbi:hypothetical protein GEMRC1_008997 [Eukaryota sp. GEM-RC1]
MQSEDLSNLIADLDLANLPHELLFSFTCVHFSESEQIALSQIFPDVDITIMQQLSSALHNISDEEFLSTFVSQSADPISLVIFLSFYMQSDQSLALYSINSYFTLLSISDAFRDRFCHLLFLQVCISQLSAIMPLLSPSDLDVFTSTTLLLPHVLPAFYQTETLLTAILSFSCLVVSFPFDGDYTTVKLPRVLGNDEFELQEVCAVGLDCVFKIFEKFHVDNNEDDFLDSSPSLFNFHEFFHKLFICFLPSFLLSTSEVSKTLPKSVLSNQLSISNQIFKIVYFKSLKFSHKSGCISLN